MKVYPMIIKENMAWPGIDSSDDSRIADAEYVVSNATMPLEFDRNNIITADGYTHIHILTLGKSQHYILSRPLFLDKDLNLA